MDFSFGNFFDDISTQCSFLLETVVTFTTPFFLRIFDFGIRTYLWIQNLPVFQVKRPYTDVLRNASWIYSGVLVHNTEYTMIHHYDIETKDIIAVHPANTDTNTVDVLYMIQNQKIGQCRRAPFVFVKPEKSNVRFLYVEFIHKENTITLDIPEEMMQVGNEIFTPAFIYRLLDHSSTSYRVLFTLNYQLIIVDETFQITTLDSGKYIVLEKNTYRIQTVS